MDCERKRWSMERRRVTRIRTILCPTTIRQGRRYSVRRQRGSDRVPAWRGRVCIHEEPAEGTGIVAANGDVVVKYYYDAYGRCLVAAGTQADTLEQLNPLRYRDMCTTAKRNYTICRAGIMIRRWAGL